MNVDMSLVRLVRLDTANDAQFTEKLLIFTHVYAIARPSVRPSVRRMYHRKVVEVRMMKFSPCGSPIALVFVAEFYSEILRVPRVGKSNKDGVATISSFLCFKLEYLENGSRYG